MASINGSMLNGKILFEDTGWQNLIDNNNGGVRLKYRVINRGVASPFESRFANLLIKTEVRK